MSFLYVACLLFPALATLSNGGTKNSANQLFKNEFSDCSRQISEDVGLFFNYEINI